ncbi:MAG: glycogen synthase GlgA [Candidatus Nitrohelix vancouverensis]|uniref:Glycogen synthase n=1 Tax=Candidatus Nitrohelix vancouverensis TaxID=2705534 RepID=A0A7T0C3E6_9BACT|nr:MAG: glycogen synthase GlgA [Candidatus Nitrohelix vancouverensis]
MSAVSPLKILFVASEAYPFAKSGGLGDFASALPKALQRAGHDVRLLLPKYASVIDCDQGLKPSGIDVSVPVGQRQCKGFLFESALPDGPPVTLISKASYFLRKDLYGSEYGEFGDNGERFIFFCRAALETCKAIGFQPDIIHCNDWQTGLVPLYLKTVYAKDPFFSKTKSVFTIHNLAYQGNFSSDLLELAHVPRELYHPEGVELYGQFSFLKAGLVCADYLTTVSPTYSKEIQTPEGGWQLEGLLKKRSDHLVGILNGVDYETWNPQTDATLPSRYSIKQPETKLACRRDLERRFALKLAPDKPLACMVTRLSHQKGIDLIADNLQRMLDQGAGFILLGSGDPEYQDRFEQLQKRFSDQAAVVIGYDEILAHQIIAGSDLILIPSRYEPCGLTQLYGLKYGTLPLARATGGLQDSVEEVSVDSAKGTGFKFDNFQRDDLLNAWNKAQSCFSKPQLWKTLVDNAMRQDFGWQPSAQRYIDLYRRALSA